MKEEETRLRSDTTARCSINKIHAYGLCRLNNRLGGTLVSRQLHPRFALDPPHETVHHTLLTRSTRRSEDLRGLSVLALLSEGVYRVMKT
jgi:hypothetical protein